MKAPLSEPKTFDPTAPPRMAEKKNGTMAPQKPASRDVAMVGWTLSRTASTMVRGKEHEMASPSVESTEMHVTVAMATLTEPANDSS